MHNTGEFEVTVHAHLLVFPTNYGEQMNIKHKHLIFPLLFLFIFTSVTATHSHVEKNNSPLSPIKITILPCMDPVKAYKKYHTLSHYLEQQTGRKIYIQVPKDYSAFLRIIKQKETDFAYQSAHVFLAHENSFNQDACLSALTPAGKRQRHAFLITRSDSSIEKVEDLQGKSVLLGPQQSTVKTFAAKQLLKIHGIDLETDLYDYSFGSSCEKNAFNVYLKAFDACFVCEHSYDALMGEKDPDWPIPPGSLKIIAETMPVPTWIFTALSHVDSSTVKKINEALLSMSSNNTEHKTILHSIESGGFVTTDKRDLITLSQQLAY